MDPDPLHYQKLEHDPSADYVNVITQWSKKWFEKGQINESIANWVRGSILMRATGALVTTETTANSVALIA